MIGNDVVDLKLAQIQSNWRRRGFLDKIFTLKEKSFILNSENPEMSVWNLWSRKEAAYKIYNRKTGFRGFIPLKLECFDLNNEFGEVVCMNQTYFTKTEISVNMIHTIALTKMSDFNQIYIPNPLISILKKGDIPYIIDCNDSISLSHHGDFYKIVGLKDYGK